MWNINDLNITQIQENPHYIHVKVSHGNNHNWVLAVVYASLREEERREMWQEIK